MSELKHTTAHAFEHTPGPWRIRKNASTMDIESQKGIQLATVWTLPTPGWDKEQANLALILAAPELLKALENLYRLVDFLPDSILEHRHVIEEIEMAKQVIAKATSKIDAP